MALNDKKDGFAKAKNRILNTFNELSEMDFADIADQANFPYLRDTFQGPQQLFLSVRKR